MPRISEFDGLRGLLAWWVVAYHIMCNSGVSNSSFKLAKILHNGRHPVNVFIILSGFVIFFLLETKPEKYSVFITRRFFRLYPAYIVCFLVSVAISRIRIDNYLALSWVTVKSVHRIEQEHHYIVEHVLAHISLLHGIFPDSVLPDSVHAFLAPAWSISLEWQFYLVAPMVLSLIKRSTSSFLAISGLVMFFDRYAHLIGRYPSPAFLPLEAQYFWLGGFSFYVFKLALKHKEVLQKTKNYLIACTATFLMVFVKLSPVIIWSVVFCAVLIKYNCTKPDKITSIVIKILNYKYLKKLGEVSYSTYLSHIPVLFTCQWFILKIFPMASKKEMLVMLTMSVVPIDIALSFLMFKTIEKPFIRLGAKLVKKL